MPAFVAPRAFPGAFEHAEVELTDLLLAATRAPDAKAEETQIRKLGARLAAAKRSCM